MENKYWIVDTNNLSTVKDIFMGYTISEVGNFYPNEKPKILDAQVAILVSKYYLIKLKLIMIF